MQCYRIDRGQDLSPVQSCDGPGDIAVFYTNAVWFCAGLTLAFLFLQGGSIRYGSTDFNGRIQNFGYIHGGAGGCGPGVIYT